MSEPKCPKTKTKDRKTLRKTTCGEVGGGVSMDLLIFNFEI